MHVQRIATLVFGCGLAGGAILGTGFTSELATKLPMLMCERPVLICPDPTASEFDASSTGMGGAFSVHEWEGLRCQITGVSASMSYNATTRGNPGATKSRSLGVSGALMDPRGGRVFRLVGSPRVLEMTDRAGRDLLASGQVHVHPAPSYSMQFSRPNNGTTNVNFGVNINGGERTPRGIGGLRIEVDAQMATDLVRVELPHERQSEMAEIAEGVTGRVSSFSVSDRGVLSMAFEYRIDLGAGVRPAFYLLDIFDIDGKHINTVNQSREVVTKNAVLGSVQVPDMNIGQRELGEVRLTMVTDVVEHTFVLEAADVPLVD